MTGDWPVIVFNRRWVRRLLCRGARRLVAASLCSSFALATITQGAHAQSAPALAARAAVDSSSVSQSDAALAEAEAAYREQRDREAFAKFAHVLAMLPREAHAWLRIGNLWQRNGETWRATEAYRRAVEAVALSRDGTEPQRSDAEAVSRAGSKAATNLAILGIEQAQTAMQSVDRSRLPAEMQLTLESIERSLRAPGAQVREPARPVLR